MKLLAKIGFGCAGIILSFIIAVIIFGLVIYFKSDNWTARSPERICKEAGFKLPSYTVIDEEDNMERGSSSWSWYYWRVKLKKPLSEKDIQQLEKLVKKDPNWNGSRHEAYFKYQNYSEDPWEDHFLSPQISISINSYDDISMRITWYDSFF